MWEVFKKLYDGLAFAAAIPVVLPTIVMLWGYNRFRTAVYLHFGRKSLAVQALWWLEVVACKLWRVKSVHGIWAACSYL
jgi:hypothetical protein